MQQWVCLFYIYLVEFWLNTLKHCFPPGPTSHSVAVNYSKFHNEKYDSHKVRTYRQNYGFTYKVRYLALPSLKCSLSSDSSVTKSEPLSLNSMHCPMRAELLKPLMSIRVGNSTKHQANYYCTYMILYTPTALHT